MQTYGKGKRGFIYLYIYLYIYLSIYFFFTLTMKVYLSAWHELGISGIYETEILNKETFEIAEN